MSIVGDGGNQSIVGDRVAKSAPPFPVGPGSPSNDITVNRPPFPGGPINDVENQDTATVNPNVSPGGTNPGRPGGESGERGPRKKPNILDQFASYNTIITFAALSKIELADPDNTYRQFGPTTKIIRSGGLGNTQVRTPYEQELGITTEYYIEDLEINSIISPGPLVRQTNATTFTFKVIEPYSMGVFLETLANSVENTGDQDRPNYASQPYLLMIEFVGFDTDGNRIPTETKRYIPLKLDSIEFDVNAGGSVYDISAYAYSEYAFADEVQAVPDDLKLRGSNVHQALQKGDQSLTTILNDKQLELKDSGNKQAADSYVIIFPEDTASEDDAFSSNVQDPVGATSVPPQIGATIQAVVDGGLDLQAIEEFADNEANVNVIGSSKLRDEIFDSGTSDVRDAETVDDPNQPQTTKSTDNVINIKKGTRIQDVIEALVQESEYGKKLAKEADNEGMVSYWRIEPEVYEIVNPANEKQRGAAAKVFVYRVVEYKVHTSRIVSPSQKSPGLAAIKKRIPKEYNYLYSGQNDDIIDFNIRFNSAFFQALQFDLFQGGQDQVDQGAQGRANTDETTPGVADAGETSDPENERGTSVREATGTGTSSAITGGNLNESTATRISRQFNEIIVNGLDLIQAEMEILGDPYFIADSGMGNYRSKRIGNQELDNGAIDYLYSDTFLILNFQTPLDINSETGEYTFPTVQGEPVRKFSGIYRITEIRNTISGNKFTQTLQMQRMRNQFFEETEGNSYIKQDGEPLSAQILSNSLPNLNQSVPQNQSLIPDTPNNDNGQSEIPQEQIGTGGNVPISGTTPGETGGA
jgi:hypothetical protein